jgi:alpha-ribazole phosphatase
MTPKTRIYLIRHGEVEGAATPRYNGQVDVPLSPRGRDQYQAMAQRLAGEKITACYSSDLIRCAWGAGLIAPCFGIEPQLTSALRELNIGDWEGMTWQELMTRYPSEWQARLDDIVNFRVPNGENLLDVEARAIPKIRQIVAAHPGEELLVVGHGGVNRVILLNALGAPLSALFNMEQSYCCLNIIDYYADGKTVVKLLNG